MTYVMLMGNWWFGARWFGFQKDPLMKGICYLGVPNNQPKPVDYGVSPVFLVVVVVVVILLLSAS